MLPMHDPGGSNKLLNLNSKTMINMDRDAVDTVVVLGNLSGVNKSTSLPTEGDSSMEVEEFPLIVADRGLIPNDIDSTSSHCVPPSGQAPDRSGISRKRPPPTYASRGNTNAIKKSSNSLANSSDNNNNARDFSKLMLSNRHNNQSQGPYDVFIQPINRDLSSLHPTTVGRLLSSNKQDIIEIKKVSYSKIMVQLKSRQAANNLINNPIF